MVSLQSEFSVANPNLRWCKVCHNTGSLTASHHLLHIPNTLSTVTSAGGGETSNAEQGEDEAELKSKEAGSSVSLHMSITLNLKK